MSFFRYPGGKRKLINEIISKIQTEDFDSYIEPFFGGGVVGLKLIESKNIKNMWINDKDIGISYIWQSVIDFPEMLKQKIMKFEPSIEHFYNFKEELLSENSNDIVDIGFKKLAIHQMSYSGLGTKSGGPLGGKKQKSQYKIDCRWSPEYMCKKIDNIHNKFKSVNIKCTNLDFKDVLNNIEKISMIYLDPPYYVKGNELYQYGFTCQDHEDLADILLKIGYPWILSYDDCPEIRDLYKWANIEQIDVNYTIKKRDSKIKRELLICRR